MLNGRLRLHDINDVEAFCARIVERTNPTLSHHDREDLLAYLITTTWELSAKHQPTLGEFSKWVGYKLSQRTVDWSRQRNGRTTWKFKGHTHHRPRPTIVSIQLLEHQHGRAINGRAKLSDQVDAELGRAYTRLTVDPAEDRSPDLTRVLRTRSSLEARPPHPRSEPAPREAA